MESDKLRVSELFYSLQGESTWAGLPCLFVRLSGCNLRCTYCDSRYTWEEPGRLMSIAEIMDWCNQWPGTMVELTGGEPLCQNGAYPLMQQLLDQGRTVLLETNGSLPLVAVPEQVHIIMDVKCPDSGMAGHNLPENIDVLTTRRSRGSRDEIKFVLSSKADFTFARDLVRRHQLDQHFPILFSPVRASLAPADLAALLLKEPGMHVRLQLQLHTLLWPESKRGV